MFRTSPPLLFISSPPPPPPLPLPTRPLSGFKQPPPTLYPINSGRGMAADSPKNQEGQGTSGKSLMDDLLGLLRVRIKRGVNLAVRDVNTSDPYVVVKMGKQKLKTRVIKKDVNPEWDEDLTLSVTDPACKFVLTVYDHDTFSKDDKMGDAECEISGFIQALKMKTEGLPTGTIIGRIQPSRQNCLAEESCITCDNGKVVQDIVLRLRNVECGEVEIQLQWIDLPGAKGL